MLAPAAKALIVANDPHSIDGFKSRLLSAIVMLITMWYFMAEINIALKVAHMGLKNKWPIALAIVLPLVLERNIGRMKNPENGQTALAAACVIALWLRLADRPHPQSVIEEQRRSLVRKVESTIDWKHVNDKVPAFEVDTSTIANTDHGRARFFIVLLVTMLVARLLQKGTDCPGGSLVTDESMMKWYAKPMARVQIIKSQLVPNIVTTAKPPARKQQFTSSIPLAAPSLVPKLVAPMPRMTLVASAESKLPTVSNQKPSALVF